MFEMRSFDESKIPSLGKYKIASIGISGSTGLRIYFFLFHISHVDIILLYFISIMEEAVTLSKIGRVFFM